jgi:hypothetical protein
METAGELLDPLERADRSERRELLDRARTAAGLASTDVEEAHRPYE